MVKVSCLECGALILPTTATNTGGVCMACKQGIRKSIDASRAYYKGLKAHDPVRELWTSLTKRSSLDPGLASWTSHERLYFAVRLMEGEVNNGGFDQYFFNSSADHYRVAVDGLRKIGALRSLNLVREAADALFGKAGPPASQADRWEILNSKTRHLGQIVSQRRKDLYLERLDKDFWRDPDKFGERLTAYAQQHGLVGPPFESRAD